MNSANPPLIDLRGVTREFCVGAERVQALRGIALIVQPGEKLAIVGPSGSGKSTVLNLIGLLDRASSGDYLFEGDNTRSLTPLATAQLRNRAIGFVFQQFHLLAHLTALENTQLPLLYRGLLPRAARDAARQALASIGMEHRMAHRPGQLSGGEKQRVAIARAIVGRPRLLLADEPTGALDSVTGAQVLDALLGAAQSSAAALVMITHDANIARQLPRRIVMRDGSIDVTSCDRV